MKTIWKFPLPKSDRAVIEMPQGAQVLCVQMQHDDLCIWALVEAGVAAERREFAIFGTGHPMPSSPGNYVGTFQLHGGSLVFHLFETTFEAT